ncbi:MAG TPA: hypothetical protein VFB38_14345 [Chthonomonadaceae bacterium]|nr:hypothetical protein [Chthonomonadaceae bacterium]
MQIGDSRVLPHVEHLAKGKGFAAKDSRIQQAAEECLPFLCERIAGQDAAETLLRGSSASNPTPDQLLRPTAGAPKTEARQLLWPQAPEE